MFSQSAPKVSSKVSFGIRVALGLAGGLLLVAPVLADAYDDREPDAYFDQRGAAEFDYADVVNVEPNMRQVRVSVPRQECYTDTRYIPDDGYAGRRRDRPAAGPMILGGLIGAVVGHQIGGGHSRGVGTVAGAVIGSAVGHDAAQRHDDDRDYRDDRPLRAIDSQRCETRYDEHYESRIESYRVIYRYHGRVYHTTMPRDPGQQLRVRVAVTPAE